MEDYTLELERVLWAISKAQRWDTISLGCSALQRMREMIKQNEKEMNYINSNTEKQAIYTTTKSLQDKK